MPMRLAEIVVKGIVVKEIDDVRVMVEGLLAPQSITGRGNATKAQVAAMIGDY